jgi:hypothetical protein
MDRVLYHGCDNVFRKTEKMSCNLFGKHRNIQLIGSFQKIGDLPRLEQYLYLIRSDLISIV